MAEGILDPSIAQVKCGVQLRSSRCGKDVL